MKRTYKIPPAKVRLGSADFYYLADPRYLPWFTLISSEKQINLTQRSTNLMLLPIRISSFSTRIVHYTRGSTLKGIGEADSPRRKLSNPPTWARLIHHIHSSGGGLSPNDMVGGHPDRLIFGQV